MEDMDVEGGFVFDRLPRDLTERVFSYLPISSIFKCRCVCKRLNALLTSTSFLEVWAQFSPKKPWFILHHSNRTIVSYLPSSNRWNNLLLSGQWSLDSENLVLIASSGGLLCFQDRSSLDSSRPSLLIYNPVSGSHRVLPNLLQIRSRYILGMVTDKVTGIYKIVVTGTSKYRDSDEVESITEVFDSRTGNWEHHHRSHNKFLQFRHQIKAIWHEGLFYVLCNRYNSWSEDCRLIAYDMDKREWINFNVKEPSADIHWPALLIYGGKLHMSGSTVETWNNRERFSIRSLRILMLSMETLQWVQMEEREDEGLKGAPYFESLFFEFHDHGVLFCVHGFSRWQYVMYNMSKRTWYQLPQDDDSCPWRVIEDDTSPLVGLVYEPSLTAKV